MLKELLSKKPVLAICGSVIALCMTSFSLKSTDFYQPVVHHNNIVSMEPVYSVGDPVKSTISGHHHNASVAINNQKINNLKQKYAHIASNIPLKKRVHPHYTYTNSIDINKAQNQQKPLLPKTYTVFGIPYKVANGHPMSIIPNYKVKEKSFVKKYVAPLNNHLAYKKPFSRRGTVLAYEGRIPQQGVRMMRSRSIK